jgi:hypothetical protein
MKIRDVKTNNRKNEFSITNRSGREYSFPYQKADPKPDANNRIQEVYIDKELGNEAITYVLESGNEGSIHIDQILEYNEDPNYFADLLTYKLTLEAQKQVEISGLSRRQLARRLKTSVPQLYRLLDPANTRKSMKQLVALLHILNCDVDLVVKEKSVA